MLLGIVPAHAPIVHSLERGLGKLLCTTIGERAGSAANIKKRPVPIPIKMVDKKLVDFAHQSPAIKGKGVVTHLHENRDDDCSKCQKTGDDGSPGVVPAKR